MVAIGQTVTIVNRSGKVVSTSKHLVNVFNEAKSAYNERKAELKAARRPQADSKAEVKKARKRLEALNLSDDDDASSMQSSRRGSEDSRTRTRKHGSESRRERPPVERGVSDSFYINEHSRTKEQRRSYQRPSQLRSEFEDEPRAGELTRRRTEGLEVATRQECRRPSPPARSASLDDIDMDLAYGELPPPLPERNYDTEVELRQKMSGLQRLLDEGNCLQHSVTAIIDNLQKNPDALAAVALTLAEISNLASKMAPGALMSMKGAFPAIIALLASPEFAIAAGVGVGVTIIALGGYKIIKKIKARKEADEDGSNLLEDGAEVPDIPDSEMDSLREISRIEQWRRGIADVEAGSAGTSVDGEFVTPLASKALIMEGKLTEADLKSSEGKKRKRKKEKKEKSEKGGKSGKSEKGKKEKEPSGLRMLFKSRG